MCDRIFLMSRSNPGTDRPYHHGHLRESLLAAALDLLAEKPSGEISLREVAKVAGVSHAAPYHHFDSRTSLLKALGTECMREFVGRQRDAVEVAGSGRDALRDQGVAYVRFAAEKPHAFDLIFDSSICPPGDPAPGTGELIRENEELLASTVAWAQRDGLFAGENTESVADAMWGTVHGLAHLVTEGHLGLDAAVTSIGAVAGGGAKG